MDAQTLNPRLALVGEPTLAARLPETEVVSSDWRRHLPVLTGRQVTLRELRLSDAPALLALLSTAEVERFISPTPKTVESLEDFIRWTRYQRETGEHVCFGVVPEGLDVAVGLFQVRRLDPTFGTAEWGFALGRPFWGSALFAESARLVIDFVFETVGAHRLEARATVENGRGNGALAKAGAVCECRLRRSFLGQDGHYVDQALWAIVRDDWVRSRRTSEADGSVH
jgi:RimJ/RimL family protein N-acetyltransferase